VSKAKHTPGPWSRAWIYGAIRHLNKNVNDDAFFSDVDDEYDKVEKGELNTPNVRNNPGDADLIAAAPDLLSALRDLHDSQNGPPLETERAEWEAAMSKAAALLKSLDG